MVAVIHGRGHSALSLHRGYLDLPEVTPWVTEGARCRPARVTTFPQYPPEQRTVGELSSLVP